MSAWLRSLSGRITVVTDCRVTAIGPDRVDVAGGQSFHSDLCVWAAGIRAPAFLAGLGLALTRGRQLDVDGHLRVKEQDHVFASAKVGMKNMRQVDIIMQKRHRVRSAKKHGRHTLYETAHQVLR